MDLEEKFYCCWPFVMIIIIVICRRHVGNVPLFVLLCCCRSYPSSTLCVRVYAADGRSLGASDCRLVCRWCAVMESSSFGRLLGVSAPVCLYACVRIGIGGGH